MRHPKFGNHDQAFAEPAWYTGSPNPYYDPSHVAFRQRVRDFVESHLKDKAAEWEEEANAGKEMSLDVFKEVSSALLSSQLQRCLCPTARPCARLFVCSRARVLLRSCWY